MKAKKIITFVLACTMVFSAVGMAVLPVGTVSAADASGTTASISDILKNQLPDGGWRKDINKQVESGRSPRLTTRLHTQKLEDWRRNLKRRMIRDTLQLQSKGLIF
ncbi:hypothetical protein [Paenibacillus xylanexedens]|uniref:Uncharacterized protein n=1 Tax=Paenibacillus xylanexedens TaxID=528191 RepID=A0ABS4RPS2_PAEXY|nr:hypothetical protein [Paenibacillus xylanexedens]